MTVYIDPTWIPMYKRWPWLIIEFAAHDAAGTEMPTKSYTTLLDILIKCWAEDNNYTVAYDGTVWDSCCGWCDYAPQQVETPTECKLIQGDW